MNWSRAQSKKPERLNRAIGLALVLALLSLQQVWAAAFCMCGHEGQPQAESDSCMHHQALPVEAHNAGAHHHSSEHAQHACAPQHSAETKASTPQSTSTSQPEALSASGSGHTSNHAPSSLSCCHIQPKAETPVVSSSVQQQALEIDGNPPQLAADVEPVALSPNVYKPPRSRPVYLTVSAFRI